MSKNNLFSTLDQGYYCDKSILLGVHTNAYLLSKADLNVFPLLQGLQRRATPHPSELKVMKKVIEERRNEAYTSRHDGEEEGPDQRVHSTYCKMTIMSGLQFVVM